MEVHLAIGIGSGNMFPMCTAWKLRLWKQISEDAKTKKAFPEDHFDASGLLQPTIQPYRGLSKWLTNLTNPGKFEGFVPSWEHKGIGLWELYLHSTEESAEWVHVERWGDQKARIIKPATRYKLPWGGIVIQGLLPEFDHEYDFCELESDDFVDIGTGCDM